MKTDQYDLVLHGYVLNMFQLGLGIHFNCPSVVIATGPLTLSIAKLVGQSSDTSSVPHFFMNAKGGMTFFQRMTNMMFSIGDGLIDVYQDFLNNIYYEQNFPHQKYPNYAKAKKNVAAVFLNSHFTQAHVRPFLPNVIEIAGLNIKDKPSKLPLDIQKWIDDARDGVILVSFGTNYKSSDQTEEIRKIFLRTFSKLKQRIIWKFEVDSIQNLPENVMIRKWLPQNDILAHPNTKMFISHMGMSSYFEAVYHAVPVVAVPLASDQPINSENAKLARWAEIVPFQQLTEQALESAVKKVLFDPKYKEAARNLSDIFKDRPMSPIDTAIYWIEYVIRYKGAPQLQYPGRDLNFIQRNSLDVIGFIVIMVYLLWKIFLIGCKKLFKMICFKRKIVKKYRNEHEKND